MLVPGQFGGTMMDPELATNRELAKDTFMEEVISTLAGLGRGMYCLDYQITLF
jgi:hypothetical protein